MRHGWRGTLAACVAAVGSGCSSGAHTQSRVQPADGSTSAENAVCSEGGSAGNPSALATGQGNPGPIAVDDANVYWINLSASLKDGTLGQELVKCSKCGCGNSPTVLAEGSWGPAQNLAVGGGSAYWGGNESVYQCPTSGCEGHPTVLFTGSLIVGDVAVDPHADVFFVRSSFGSADVSVCPAGRCGAAGGVDWLPTTALPAFGTPTFVQTAVPIAIATDALNLYVLGSGSSGGVTGAVVTACSLGGCSATARALLAEAGPEPAAILAVDDTFAYFVSGGAVNASTTVHSVPKESANPWTSSTTLVSGLSFPSAIASDGTNVYIAEAGDIGSDGARPPGSGRIGRCAVKGCGGSLEAVRGYVDGPQGLALDETYLFWSESDLGADASYGMGRVMMQPK